MIRLIGFAGYLFNKFVIHLFEIFSIIAFIRYLPFSVSSKYRNRYIFVESFLKAVYETGIRTLYVTSIISILFGIFLSLQIINYININENNIQVFIKFLIILIIHEIGPLVGGIILILRALSYISVRFSLMKVRDEHEVLMSFGINPIVSIIVPTLLAFPLSLLAIIFYFDFISISIGYIILSYYNETIEFGMFWKMLLFKIGSIEVILTLLKALIGGMVIGAIGIYFSQKVEYKLSLIADSVSISVTSSTVVFLIINFAISIIGY